MPRYRRKRLYRKRPYKKRRVIRRRKRVLPVGGFPSSKIVKLRYVETISFDAGTGSYALNNFRANSIFDPNSTGVGHQPSNFDRWALLYDRYTVLGSRCKVDLVPQSTNTEPGIIVLHLSEAGDDITLAHGSGGINNILEQPRMSATRRNYYANNGPGIKPLYKSFSAKKFFSVKNIVGLTPYSADIATNPVEGAFYEVAVVSADDVNNPGAIKLRITIDYIAMLTEPKLSDAS